MGVITPMGALTPMGAHGLCPPPHGWVGGRGVGGGQRR